MSERAVGVFATRFETGVESPITESRLEVLNRFKVFPFAGEIVRVALDEFDEHEPGRSGEGGVDCEICARSFSDANIIWEDDEWAVTVFPTPRAFPSVTVFPKKHEVYPNVPDDVLLASGRLVQDIARILESLHGIATTHVSMRRIIQLRDTS